jgi:hypothetical protein
LGDCVEHAIKLEGAVVAVLGWWCVRAWQLFCTGIAIGINGECSSGHSDWPKSWGVSTPDAWHSPRLPLLSAATVGDRSGAEVICAKQAKNTSGESISCPSSPPLLQLSTSHNADKVSVASLSLRVDSIVSVPEDRGWREALVESWTHAIAPNAPSISITK